MPFGSFIDGRFLNLERFNIDHIPELRSIAIDEKIWQNLPYNIKDDASFAVFIKELLCTA